MLIQRALGAEGHPALVAFELVSRLRSRLAHHHSADRDQGPEDSQTDASERVDVVSAAPDEAGLGRYKVACNPKGQQYDAHNEERSLHVESSVMEIAPSS